MKQIALFVLAAAASAYAGAAPAADSSSYQDSMSKAKADYRAAHEQCRAQSGSAETICIRQAKATRAHAEADAAAQYNASPRTQMKMRTAAVNADYDLAKAQCRQQSGDERSTCLQTAKASRTSAMADARSAMPRGDMNNASQTARINCDNMSGTDKAGCMTRNGARATENAVTDTVITGKIKADLIGDPVLKAMDVHVDTVRGVVTLSGFVPSQQEAQRAVDMARKVDGVTDVRSSLQVR